MKPDNELQKKWNKILLKQGLDAIKPSKPSRKEKRLQKKSGYKGIPKGFGYPKKGR